MPRGLSEEQEHRGREFGKEAARAHLRLEVLRWRLVPLVQY